MNRYAVEQKFKSFAAFLVILILLPYIVSVFVNGADFREKDETVFYVKVRVSESQEADGIAEVNWTDYLAGILALEVPEDYGEEAMKAQAVLLRTQIYRSMEGSEDGILEWDFLTKDEMEDMQGAEKGRSNYEKYVRAVEETDDTVLMYNGAYAWTPFHQSSNGKTRSAAEVMGSEVFPYVAVRECPLDKEAEDEIQVFHFSFDEIQKLCRDFLVAAEDNEKAEQGYVFSDFEITACDSAGYVSRLRIGNTVCTGDQFRDALSLPSSSFSLSEGEDGELVVTTTGKGHGLGMSIWTAGKMAEEGRTYEEILAFFFDGTEIKNDIQENFLQDIE